MTSVLQKPINVSHSPNCSVWKNSNLPCLMSSEQYPNICITFS